jgi:hypothetical protein
MRYPFAPGGLTTDREAQPNSEVTYESKCIVLERGRAATGFGLREAGTRGGIAGQLLSACGSGAAAERHHQPGRDDCRPRNGGFAGRVNDASSGRFVVHSASADSSTPPPK